MKWHVSRTVSSCFYHLRRQLRHHVDIDTMNQLVPAFIFTWLDCCNTVLYGLPQSIVSPSTTSAERRCAVHTWSVTAWSCPSGAEGAALAASRSSNLVQGRAFDVYGTWQSLSCVSKWIRSTSQQQPSTSTSSLCHQPRLHCSTDKN